MTDINFNHLYKTYTWKPIYGCPGRFILKFENGPLSLEELAGSDAQINIYKVPAAPDPVYVVKITGGGLISYAKPDGSFLHTLCTHVAGAGL